MQENQSQPTEDVAGGCAVLTALIFVLTGLAWPLWQLSGLPPEPEIFFVPMLIGAPAFILTHLLARRSIAKQPQGAAMGTTVLRWLRISLGIGFVIWVIICANEPRGEPPSLEDPYSKVNGKP